MENLQHTKIAVVGAGGVGGYLAAMLGQKFPHLTVAARGKKAEQLAENGLVLHSDLHGEINTRPERIVPAEELGAQNVVFICVKNYSLEEVCRSIAPHITEDTIVVPVMNGVDPADRTAQYLGKGIVLHSLIYIIGFVNPDGSSAQQGPKAEVHIGITEKEAGCEKARAALQLAAGLLTESGVLCITEEDIEAAIWKKYILNCAYNVMTARYDLTIGQLRADPVKAAEYGALVGEAWSVGKAKGIHVTEDDRERISRDFYRQPENATSSLQRDVAAGRPSEADTFCGYIVREGEKLGIDTPVMREMYAYLCG